jgi:hypothetical protein
MKKISGYWVMVHHHDTTKNIPAIVFTDSEESAIDQVKRMFSTCKDVIFMDKTISWNLFKKYFDTTDWPDFLKEEDEGYFEEEVFESVCDFCMEGFAALMKAKEWTAIKIETNPN